MAIDIVIPAYNAEDFLDHTIESVRRQTIEDWRLIVVDDGSGDGTVDIARAHADRDARIDIVGQSNGGVARARNAGLAKAEGDFVMLLDHDDMLRPNALELLRAVLSDAPEAVGAHGLARKVDAGHSLPSPSLQEGSYRIQNFDRRKLVDGKVTVASRKEPTTAAMVVFDNLIPTPGVALLRRSTIDALGAAGEVFDPAAAPLDDWDFWLRVTRLGNLAFVDETVLDWRRHEAAGSQNVAAMSAAEMRIRERLLAQDLPADLAEVARHRYEKLLATTRRRAARERWSSARTELRSGKIGAALGEWSSGMRDYMGYLRSKSAR